MFRNNMNHVLEGMNDFITIDFSFPSPGYVANISI